MESQMYHFIVVSLSFFSLLIISSFIYLFSKKVKLPYTILLFITGLLLAFIAQIPFMSWIASFKLTPEILFYIFLPILLFEAAYNINYKELLKNSKTIFTLAVIGLLISTFIIGVVLYYIFNFMGFGVPLGVTLLFGAIISATDPVAVLALFKAVGAPRRLSLIFDGESLFNDGTSVALFLIILSVLEIIAGGGNFVLGNTFFHGFLTFLSMVLGGIVLGLFMGWIFSLVLGKIKNQEEVEITLTLVAAHTTFLLAEFISHTTALEISGIIATTIAGIIMGNYGRDKVSPKVVVFMEKFWEYSTWLVNSIIFLLIGLMVYHLNIEFMSYIPYILVMILVVVIARGISVYLPLGVLSKFKLAKPVPMSWQHLLSWGSLRGSLALMMALMIPEHLTLPGWSLDISVKDFVILLVISAIIFTLTVKAFTISPLINKLGINKLHSLEKFEYYEGHLLALLKMLEELERIHKKGYITEEEYNELNKKYNNKLEKVIDGMKKLLETEKDSSSLIRKALSLHALGIEKQHLKDLFKYNEIDEDNYRVLFGKIRRQQDRIEMGLPQFRNNNLSKDDKNIFERYIEKSFDKTSPINKYIRNRARSIILKKTILDLEVLKKVNLHFDKKYFDEIIKLYTTLLKESEEKLKKLLEDYKTTTMALETKLSEKVLLKIEEKIIKELYEKEIITPKLYHKIMEEIDTEIYNENYK